MNFIKSGVISAGLIAAAVMLPMAANAQESSYKPGTVWTASRIKVLPGQFENFMDSLATRWKKVQELGKKEGIIVAYHVLSTNNARQGEANLILIVETKDYQTIAQQTAFGDKVEALLGEDDRKAQASSLARGSMRENIGSTQYQELVLK